MKSFEKLPGGVKFFLATGTLYAAIFFINADFAKKSFVHFSETFLGMLPILAVVFFVMFLSYFFVSPELVKRHLGRDSGAKGYLWATLGAIAISGPPYVLFPILRDLKKHGMKYSLVAVFMNNRNVQPTFLPVIAYYFGTLFTIVFAFYIIVFSLLSGLIIGRLMKE
ncbi:MAG: hypothetical protein A2288_02145 [Candidatus Moranbacteria bacterium RIFOXYA12_FULL_44_15]|nr:MAG: hypothetical protein A2288_02145 [Candidatus Moranbacteria bacterium RIFOXYA12_FULL_44_15]OGI34524.1 MAG: hypothetical protein A2259_01265 [Candidatus Moranbacteria bacterium RIFOXYA2_FULL_43_15]